MNPPRILATLPPRRLTLAQVTLLISFLMVCLVGLASSAAQSAQETQEIPAVEGRELKNTVPAHVPITIKLKNEQRFQNMSNQNWARDLEIEVTNTGTKPIYYLNMMIIMPEIVISGGKFGIPLAYGRSELMHLENPLDPTDVPVRPGESIILKILEKRASRFPRWIEKEHREHPKQIELSFQLINFGDGTGLRSAEAYHYQKRQAKKTSSVKEAGGVCQAAPGGRATDVPGQFLKAFYSPEPASFLRAYFSPPAEVAPLIPAAPLQASFCGCLNDDGCIWGERGFDGCGV